MHRVTLRLFSTRKRILEEAQMKQASDKAKLKWSKDYIERGEWYSKLRLFANDNEDMDFMTSLQQPRDISVQGVKNYFQKKSDQMEQQMQSYIPARNEMLGTELAAAHFVAYRGGKVRFVGATDYEKADEIGEYAMPTLFDEKYKVEALDFEEMDLFYEGLENIRLLGSLKFLSFRNVKRFDDWCLDRVSGSHLISLNTLNLVGTKVTTRGLGALYRVPSLRTLIVGDSLKSDPSFELTFFLLQDIIPELKVVHEE